MLRGHGVIARHGTPQYYEYADVQVTLADADDNEIPSKGSTDVSVSYDLHITRHTFGSIEANPAIFFDNQFFIWQRERRVPSPIAVETFYYSIEHTDILLSEISALSPPNIQTAEIVKAPPKYFIPQPRDFLPPINYATQNLAVEIDSDSKLSDRSLIEQMEYLDSPGILSPGIPLTYTDSFKERENIYSVQFPKRPSGREIRAQLAGGGIFPRLSSQMRSAEFDQEGDINTVDERRALTLPRPRSRDYSVKIPRRRTSVGQTQSPLARHPTTSSIGVQTLSTRGVAIQTSFTSTISEAPSENVAQKHVTTEAEGLCLTYTKKGPYYATELTVKIGPDGQASAKTRHSKQKR